MPEIDIKAGTCWRYRTLAGLEDSRIIIGAVVRFPAGEAIACCAVTGAGRRLPDGSEDRATIPFLPLTAEALARSITEPDHAGPATPPEGFLEAFEAWRADERGLSAFTVPFEGYLDRLIALQMAQIVGPDRV